MRRLKKRPATAIAIGAIVAIGFCTIVLAHAWPKPQSLWTENSKLPAAVAEERELITAELRAQPRLELELRSRERRRTFLASDGTRLTVFSTPDAVVIQYGAHEYATVTYP